MGRLAGTSIGMSVGACFQADSAYSGAAGNEAMAGPFPAAQPALPAPLTRPTPLSGGFPDDRLRPAMPERVHPSPLSPHPTRHSRTPPPVISMPLPVIPAKAGIHRCQP